MRKRGGLFKIHFSIGCVYLFRYFWARQRNNFLVKMAIITLTTDWGIKDYYLGDDDGNSDITVESKSEDSEQS